jgi:type I restriction enzyme, S subunit
VSEGLPAQGCLAALVSHLGRGAAFDLLRMVIWEWAVSGLLSPSRLRGWTVTRFCDLGTFSGGSTPSKSNRSFWGGRIPWVSPKDMKTSLITSTEDCVSEEALATGRLKLLPANAVLMVVRSGILRRTVPVALAGIPCTINQDMKALVVGNGVTPAYARLLVKGLERRILRDFVKGGMTVQSLMWDALANHEVRLPPVEEQARILERVNRLLSLGSQLEERCLEQDQVRCRFTKAALRDLAVAAPCGPELRNALQPFVLQFDRVAAQADDLELARDAFMAMAARGVLASSVGVRPVEAARAAQAADLPELPSGWGWSTVGDLATSMDAGWSPQCAERPTSDDAEWGVLKTTSVQRAEFLPEHHKALPKGLSPRPELCVRAGDVLVTRAGPTARVGVACCVPKVRDRLMLSDKIIRVRFREDLVDPRFAALVLNVGASSAFLRAAQSGMDLAQVNISQDRLRKTPLPVAPLALQRESLAAFASVERQLGVVQKALGSRHELVSRLSEALAERAAAGEWNDRT